ncbi:MAG: hypothetical protein HY443_01150, partial [Candidatus Nealsonbacteria bacterium]|nr:hypothetical protein [Candidatus Nealsonbacteria bacterium]
MMKKLIGLIIILLLFAGGIFFWRNNTKDVRELNKGLPKGVRVEKSLFGFGNEYKVVNKIDGYEFKVPERLRGIKSLDYFFDQEQNSSGLIVESISDDFIRFVRHKLNPESTGLEEWVIASNQNLDGVYSNRDKDRLG